METLESLRADLEAETRKRTLLEAEVQELRKLFLDYVIFERAHLIARVRWAENNGLVQKKLAVSQPPISSKP